VRIGSTCALLDSFTSPTPHQYKIKTQVVKEVKRALPCYLVDPTAGGPLALDETYVCDMACIMCALMN
jgi:hypothetical protein